MWVAGVDAQVQAARATAAARTSRSATTTWTRCSTSRPRSRSCTRPAAAASPRTSSASTRPTTAPATCTRSPPTCKIAGHRRDRRARVRHGDLGALAAGRRDGSAAQPRPPPLPQVGRRAELPGHARSSTLSARFDRVILDVYDSREQLPRAVAEDHASRSTRGASCSSCTRTTGTATRSRLRPGQVPLETMPDSDVFKLQAQVVW